MFQVAIGESNIKRNPEQLATVFVDVYLQSKCKDNENMSVINDGLRHICIYYKAVVAKKAIAEKYVLPLPLVMDLSEATFSAVLDDVLKKLRGEKT